MANLGKAVSILLKHQRQMDAIYEDLHAFHAPSECYPSDRALGKRFRPVRRHACHVAGVKNIQQLRKAVIAACPTWDRYNHFRLGVEAI